MKPLYGIAFLIGIALTVMITPSNNPEPWIGAGHVTYREQQPWPTPPTQIIAEIQPVEVDGRKMNIIILHGVSAEEIRMIVAKMREGKLATVKY